MSLSVTVTDDLNIRKDAGVENERIGGAPSGCSYEVSEVKKDSEGTSWYKIGDGWVSGKYCDVKNSDTSSTTQVTSPVTLGTDTSAEVNSEVGDETSTDEDSGNGLEDTLNGLLGDSVTQDMEMEYYHRRVFGMPYQFLPATDIRPDGGNLGRIFTTNILTEAPIMSILPCKPNYLPSLSADDKKNVMQSFLDLAGDLTTDLAKDAANAELSKFQTKYFSCDLDHTEYMKYVNLLCRSSAVFMGLGSETVPGTDTLYSDYDWSNYRLSNLYDNSTSLGGLFANGVNADTVAAAEKAAADAMANPTDTVLNAISTEQYYVSFFVTPSTSYSESFSNRTDQSAWANLVNKGEGMMKELAFLLGANAIDSSVLASSANNFSEEMKKELGKFSLTKGDNVISRILTDTQTIISGSNIIFPEIYHDSEYSKSYRAEVKLISPYGNKEAIFLNIIVPMMHLLGFAIPRMTTVNTYKSPTLIKAHINKWFSCEMGIIDSLDIQKGGDGAWSADGFPTEVTISIGIKDLYSALSLSKTDSIGEAYMFAQNEALMEYLSVVCGLDLEKSEYKLKMDLVKAIASNMPGDIIDNKAKEAREKAARMAMNLFRGMTGGRF